MVVPLLVGRDEVAASHDLLEREVRDLIRIVTRELGKRDEQQRERGDALLAVDDEHPTHARKVRRAVEHHDDRAREVRALATTADGDDVVPELLALPLVPGVSALVDGNDHAVARGGEQVDDALRSGVRERPFNSNGSREVHTPYGRKQSVRHKEANY